MRSRPRPLALASLLLAGACSGDDGGAGRVEVQVAGGARAWTQDALAHAVDGEPLSGEAGPLQRVVPGSRGLSVQQRVRLGRL